MQFHGWSDQRRNGRRVGGTGVGGTGVGEERLFPLSPPVLNQ